MPEGYGPPCWHPGEFVELEGFPRYRNVCE